MRKVAVMVTGALVLAGSSLAACGAIVGAAAGSGGSRAEGGAAGGVTGMAEGSPAAAGGPAAGGALVDVPAVPAAWVALDQSAAGTCPGLGWSVLAAIGRVESDSGRSTAPGVASGANAAGAEGPMQFEPATFAAYAVVGPGGATPPSPYDAVDAVYTAAHLLCANGAGTAAGVYAAVWDYNHSAGYVATVLVLACALTADPSLGAVPAGALAFAAQQLGVPYRWGGTGDGGYDCSGLVQAAYAAAGVALPRVTQDQYDEGTRLGPGTAPAPGDLVFFGSSPSDVTHVGLLIGGGDMIDATHTGTVVRVQATPTDPGAPWGTDEVIGVTRPAA